MPSKLDDQKDDRMSLNKDQWELSPQTDKSPRELGGAACFEHLLYVIYKKKKMSRHLVNSRVEPPFHLFLSIDTHYRFYLSTFQSGLMYKSANFPFFFLVVTFC